MTLSIVYAIRYAYGMLLPDMLAEWRISKVKAGSLFSVYFVVYTCCAPVLGALSDLLNYRLLISAFCALMSIGALMMGFTNNFVQAYILFAIVGLGAAACYAPMAALVLKWVSSNRRGTALSFVTMGVGVGVTFWALLLPAIVSASHWKIGWISLGGVGLGIALLNLILIRNPLEAPEERGKMVTTLQSFYKSYHIILFDKIFWVIGISYLLMGFNVLIPFGFLPIYAREELSLSFAVSTRLIAMIAFFSIFGQLILGTLSDKLGRINVMMTCGLIMGAACLLMLLSPSAWMLHLAAASYGFGYGAVWPVYAACASDFFPRTNTGGVVGLWTLFLGIGSIFSPVICGWSIDQTQGYTWVFLFGTLSGVLATVSLLMIRRSRRGDAG